LRTRAARLRHPRRQREHQPYGRRVTCRLQAQSGPDAARRDPPPRHSDESPSTVDSWPTLS